MTIREFFESEDKLAIHCKTEEQAIKLLNKYDRLGYEWVVCNSDYNYKTDTRWYAYMQDTCYDNDLHYNPVDYYKENKYTILEFEDIDFE